MNRIVKLCVGGVAICATYLVALGFILRALRNQGRYPWIAFWVLAVLGVVVAGLAVWYLWRRVPAPTGDNEVDRLFAAARMALSGADKGRRSSLRATPVVVVLGRGGAAKTTLVSRSPFGSVLLAGQDRRADDSSPPPTPVGNIWFSDRALIVEAGGTLIGDSERWPNFVRRILPGRGFAALFKGVQAPRMAVVCLSSEDLVQPNAGEALAKIVEPLQAAIADLAIALGIRLPVYVVFTKADKIPGFPEAVSGLSREETREVLGATLPMELDEPVGLYQERQSRRLTERFAQLHTSLTNDRLRVLSRNSDVQSRAKAYEFARAFQKLAPTAVQFLVDLGRPNPLRKSAFLRGFYFVGVRPVVDEASKEIVAAARPAVAVAVGATAVLSGVPIDFGQPSGAQPQSGVRRKPQWVFLDRLFSDVVLADDAARGVTSQGTRVDVLRRSALGIVGFAAIAFILGTTWSFVKNRDLQNRVNRAIRDAESLTVKQGDTVSLATLRQLETLRGELSDLELYAVDGHGPIGLRWGLYNGDALIVPAHGAYFEAFGRVLLVPTRTALVRQLDSLSKSAPTPALFGQVNDALKTYLIITEHQEHGGSSVSPSLMTVWRVGRSITPEETGLAAEQFLFYSAELPLSPHLLQSKPNLQLVNTARAFFKQFVGNGLYALMRDSINRATKPFNFVDASGIVIDSDSVPGAYTANGWPRMAKERARIADYATTDTWVTDLPSYSLTQIDSLKQSVKLLYEADYVDQWRNYVNAAQVEVGGTWSDVETNIVTLSSLQSPLLNFLRAVSSNTKIDSSISKHFGAVGAVVSPTNADAPIPATQNYQTALAVLGQTAAKAADDKSTLDRSIPDAQKAASRVLAAATQLTRSFPADGEPSVNKKIDSFLRRPAEAVDEVASGQRSVGETFVTFCKAYKSLTAFYPFDSAESEIPVSEFIGMFAPKNGRLSTLLAGPLRSAVTLNRNRTEYERRLGGPNVSQDLLVVINSLWAIQQAFFWDGQANPSFTLRLSEVRSDSAQSVTLKIDTDSFMWMPKSSIPHDATWHLKTSRRASLRAETRNRQNLGDSMAASPWSLLKLFRDATPLKDSTGIDVYRWSDFSLQVDSGAGAEILSRRLFKKHECPVL